MFIHMFVVCLLFFFKQKTAYEMRISDWSSDVCSSDLIPLLKAAFKENGTVTPASSSANADGAAALVLTRRSEAETRGLPVIATILGHAVHAQDRKSTRLNSSH